MGNINPKDWSGTVVNIITGCVGIILILSSILLKVTNTCGIVFLSIGASILASAIVTFISSRYLLKQNHLSDLINRWGIQNIYLARAEMNTYSNELLKCTNKLDIIAFGLKSFRESQGIFIKDRVSKGMRLRILTINPESEYLIEIDNNENLSHGATKKTIEQLAEWIEDIKKVQKYEGQVQVKYYNGLPLDFYFACDSAIFVGPYHVGKGSQQTITFEFNSIAQGYRTYSEYFENLWKNTNYD